MRLLNPMTIALLVAIAVLTVAIITVVVLAALRVANKRSRNTDGGAGDESADR